MIAHSQEKRDEVLCLLQQNRGYKEISARTKILTSTIEDWAADWRRSGELKVFIRPGAAFTAEAKRLSNGYYKSIRKRYLGMKWSDRLEKRVFGFESPVEAIQFYLDENGKPRSCTYCGRYPEIQKVWGLDRLDSLRGHQPGNLVPCCGSHKEGIQLSCQASKSKYSLFGWMEMNISRCLGRPATQDEVLQRIQNIKQLADSLAVIG
jgi:hypothetical protein